MSNPGRFAVVLILLLLALAWMYHLIDAETTYGGGWKIIAALNDKSGQICHFQVPIVLTGVSTSPASDNAWPDPTVTDGNGCNF